MKSLSDILLYFLTAVVIGGIGFIAYKKVKGSQANVTSSSLKLNSCTNFLPKTIDVFPESGTTKTYGKYLASDETGSIFYTLDQEIVKGFYASYLRKRDSKTKSWSTLYPAELYKEFSQFSAGLITSIGSNIYVALVVPTQEGLQRGLIMKSTDAGNTWSLDSELASSDGSQFLTRLWIDNEQMFVSSFGFVQNSILQWNFWKKSTVWERIDSSFQHDNGKTNIPTSIWAKNDSVIVVGSANDNSEKPSTHWIVRQNSADNKLWKTTDLFQLHPGKYSTANGVTKTADGRSLVIGTAQDSNDVKHLLIRESKDDGITWRTKEMYSKESQGSDILMDNDQSIIVSGKIDREPTFRWLVRRQDVLTKDWTTIDEFSLAPGRSCEAISMAKGKDGTFYVLGTCDDANGIAKSVLRSYSCDPNSKSESLLKTYYFIIRNFIFR